MSLHLLWDTEWSVSSRVVFSWMHLCGSIWTEQIVHFVWGTASVWQHRDRADCTFCKRHRLCVAASGQSKLYILYEAPPLCRSIWTEQIVHFVWGTTFVWQHLDRADCTFCMRHWSACSWWSLNGGFVWLFAGCPWCQALSTTAQCTWWAGDLPLLMLGVGGSLCDGWIKFN